MKTSSITLSVFALGLICTGCVSTGKYQLKVDEASRYQTEVADLTTKVTDLTDRLNQAGKEIDSLLTIEKNWVYTAENLNSTIASLQENNANLTKAMEASQVERNQMIAELTKSKQELEASLADLRQQMHLIEDEKSALQSQLDALALEKETELKRLSETYKSLLTGLEREIEQGEITISQLQDRLSVKIVDQVLFLSGEAEIRPRGQQVLTRVADILKNMTDQRIVIEGHTDNVPIGPKLRDRYATNWELSAARATAVVRYLAEKLEIDPKRISMAGYGEYKPVDTNTTPEGRQKNRRIEIILVPI